ncbi:MAG: hypothetical protein ACKOW0_00755 [Schleiferiaceae bacterium]
MDYNYDIDYIPTTNYTPSYDYGLSSGGSYGLQAPSGSSGLGLSYSPTYSPTYSATPDYSLTGSTPAYTPGLTYPTYTAGASSYKPAAGGSTAWWDSAPSYTPSFTAGTGVSLAPAGGFGSEATLRAGSGAPGLTTGSFMGPATTVSAAPTQSGIAGGFGVSPMGQAAQPSALEQSATGLTPGVQAAIDRVNAQTEVGVFDKAKTWLTDPKNRDLVRLGIQGLGALAGTQARSKAEEQARLAGAATQQNNAMAQRYNEESVRSLDEARSLYNPQEMAVRGLAQTRGTTQRAIADMRKELARRGLSPAAIEAEVRRAQVAGAAGEATAYAKGLDTGRSAQQSAISGARQLYAPLSANTSLADYYAKQGAQTSDTAIKLLESYLGYPTLFAQEDVRRRLQEGSIK